MGFLIVFLGGGVGAALRHGVNLASARAARHRLSRMRTLIENVTGSLVMGLLAGYFAFRGGASQHWQLFLTTGILGGYTTFSAFSLDAALLYERGELGLAALYVVLSVVLSIGGLFAGLCDHAPRLEPDASALHRHAGRAGPSARMSRSRPGLGVVRSFGP